MIQGLLIGLIVGGLIGFVVCAALAASADKNGGGTPCKIGDRVYTIYDGTDDVVTAAARIEELTVTEVGTSRIFCSSCVPPGDDTDFEIPISEIGVRYFLCREDAERRMKGGDG